ITAFWSLGSLTNPERFCRLARGESAVFSFPQETTLTKLMYYPGLNTGDYNIEVTADGTTWYGLWAEKDEDGSVKSYYWADTAGYEPGYALPQHYADLYKWLEITPTAPVQAKQVRLTARPDSDRDWLELGELAFYDADGVLLSTEGIRATGPAAGLFDEAEAIPAAPSWYHSTYFDEIYHARTAQEHLRGMYPYEISHPPLGKLILSIGIAIFGMNPFGWRFMGTLFGVLMLPLLYCFLKNLFGKTNLALCGTALFAFDFMHLTQTRIATIDTYGVFFILAMYYFMYRYLALPAGSSFRRGALPLFLSGLMWGLGAASKWTVIYGAVGLALLYFLGLYFRWRDWDQSKNAPAFAPWLLKTLLFSVFCFVIIPAAIYTAAYIPYAAARDGLTLAGTVKVMLENQKYMLNYHKGVMDSHPYSSRWYQWIVDGRPILYYLDGDSRSLEGLKSAFGAFSNPIVCWAGLLSMLSVGVQAVRRRCGKALFIVVGYLSQLVPWMAIGRTTFEYHYFPSILFLVLAIAYLMHDLLARGRKADRQVVYALTGSAVFCYAAFYPVLTGIFVPTWYTTNLLQWLPSWPF
ncbi:MAG: glycosyltransferase family 39 protein, partial [Pseudoflavonifractor sp.]